VSGAACPCHLRLALPTTQCLRPLTLPGQLCHAECVATAVACAARDRSPPGSLTSWSACACALCLGASSSSSSPSSSSSSVTMVVVTRANQLIRTTSRELGVPEAELAALVARHAPKLQVSQPLTHPHCQPLRLAHSLTSRCGPRSSRAVPCSGHSFGHSLLLALHHLASRTSHRFGQAH
jgi:hypothetical protein